MNPRLSSFSLALLFAVFPTQHGWAADYFAKSVVFAHVLNGNVGNSQSDPSRALGPSDNAEVSLGGPGASIILDMGADTPLTDAPGPDLEVREIGTAFGGVDESYRVLVSNSTDTNSFVFVGVGRALSLLDIAPSGLASARYIWIQDLATETLNTQTPGADIDSLRSLHYSGGDGTIAPPTAVGVRLTGQGALVSWTASSTTNVTGYAIRRSIDGISFPSTPDATARPDETAWHDSNLPIVGGITYAVSTLTADGESELRIVSFGGTELVLTGADAQHLGDTPVAAWEDPSPDREWTLTFILPSGASGPQAELAFDIFDTDYSANPIVINGTRVATLPAQSAETWAARTVTFPTGVLQAGLNTLRISAMNSSGGTSGELDDFQLRNLKLRLYGTQADISLLTSTRITSVSAEATSVTLRWVVEQTPSLTPAVWETVSSPLEWKGAITPTNGFFRLRDLP